GTAFPASRSPSTMGCCPVEAGSTGWEKERRKTVSGPTSVRPGAGDTAVTMRGGACEGGLPPPTVLRLELQPGWKEAKKPARVMATARLDHRRRESFTKTL